MWIALATVIIAVILGIWSNVQSTRGTDKIDETLKNNNTELIEAFNNNHSKLMNYLASE